MCQQCEIEYSTVAFPQFYNSSSAMHFPCLPLRAENVVGHCGSSLDFVYAGFNFFYCYLSRLPEGLSCA